MDIKEAQTNHHKTSNKNSQKNNKHFEFLNAFFVSCELRIESGSEQFYETCQKFEMC